MGGSEPSGQITSSAATHQLQHGTSLGTVPSLGLAASWCGPSSGCSWLTPGQHPSRPVQCCMHCCTCCDVNAAMLKPLPFHALSAPLGMLHAPPVHVGLACWASRTPCWNLRLFHMGLLLVNLSCCRLLCDGQADRAALLIWGWPLQAHEACSLLLQASNSVHHTTVQALPTRGTPQALTSHPTAGLRVRHAAPPGVLSLQGAPAGLPGADKVLQQPGQCRPVCRGDCTEAGSECRG